jgi:exodeoxyribonuclease-3
VNVKSVKIATWNVNGIRSVTKKGFYEFWEKTEPDILCLQETKAHPDLLEDALVTPIGWQSYWSSAQRAGYSGVVTYCRTAPEQVSYGIGIPKFDAEGRIVVTRFKEFTLFNIYFPNGGSGQERHLFKQEFLRKLQTHLLRRLEAGEQIVVVGDYNVAYLDIDVHDPKSLSQESGFLPEERKWFGDFLEGGFIDAYRYLHPDDKSKYTWWAYYQNARVNNRGWRIDHICVSRGLESSLRSAEILDQQEGSDHCPVVVELNLESSL